MKVVSPFIRTNILRGAVVLLLVTSFAMTACSDETVGDNDSRDDQSWNNPSSFNSDHFDLSKWKLTLPVKGEKGKAKEVENLTGFETAHFYDAPDKAMVFVAPVDGPTTKGSKYPRSELREMNNGKEAAWTIATGGTMSATLKIDKTPIDKEGHPARLVIGQIHGKKNELIRLYWQDNTVYFNNDQSGPENKENSFYFQDASGRTPKIQLGEKFAYVIDAYGETLNVRLYTKDGEYKASSPINDIWTDDVFYFKAGVYLGVNKDQGAKGQGKVSFYALDYSHVKGQGLKGLKL